MMLAIPEQEDIAADSFVRACAEAVERHPGDAVNAWRHVGAVFGYQFLRRFAAALKDDKKVPAQQVTQRPYGPRKITPERIERRERLQEIVRSKYKNSAGVAWSDVCWNQLRQLSRDGLEAGALLQASPQVAPNDGRTVGDVLGVSAVNKIIGALRAK